MFFSTKEIENIILANDFGKICNDELELYLKQKRITPEQYDNIRKKVHLRRAKEGYADSQYIYARLIRGLNKAEEERYLLLSAEQGFIEAMIQLRLSYSEVVNENGMGFGRNPDKERYWLEQAAMTGDADSMDRLGTEYIVGDLYDVDVEKAEKWYMKAAESGSASAFMHLEGMEKYLFDYKKREFFLRNALNICIQKNDGESYCSVCDKLGYLYTPRKNNPISDATKAIYFFTHAIVWGNEYDKKNYKELSYARPKTKAEIDGWINDAENMRVRM